MSQLSVEQELELLAQAKSDQNRALDLVLKHYDAPLCSACKYWARKLSLPSSAMEDLQQEARLSMAKIIAKFDSRHGARFATFMHDQIGAIAKSMSQAERREAPILDWTQYEPDNYKPKESSKRHRISARPITDYWPAAAVEFVERKLRPRDRKIASALWIEWPPQSQSDIARSLKITKQAVSERKQVLTTLLEERFGKLYMGEPLLAELKPWETAPEE